MKLRAIGFNLLLVGLIVINLLTLWFLFLAYSQTILDSYGSYLITAWLSSGIWNIIAAIVYTILLIISLSAKLPQRVGSISFIILILILIGLLIYHLFMMQAVLSGAITTGGILEIFNPENWF